MRAFASDAAALDAVAAGEGVMLALWHAAMPAVHRHALRRLDVRGTPVVDRWYASTLGDRHCLTGAEALRRFATSREATQRDGLAPRRGPRRARARRRSTRRCGARSGGRGCRWPRRSGAPPRILGGALERGDRLEQEPPQRRDEQRLGLGSRVAAPVTQARVASVEKAWKQRRASRAAGVSRDDVAAHRERALDAALGGRLDDRAELRVGEVARAPDDGEPRLAVARRRRRAPAATLCARRSSSGVSGPAVRTSASAAPPWATTARNTPRMPPK